MIFLEIFNEFLRRQAALKVVYIASCRENVPNCAPKMLASVEAPNQLYFLDYRFTVTFQNISANPKASVSIMDDTHFVGYRLTGDCRYLDAGSEFESIKKIWQKRVASYLADRMIKRLRGEYSAKIAEESLPEDYLIARFEAREASVVKPDRILRA